MVFNAEGSLLASAGGDATVRVWGIGKMNLLATLTSHRKGVTSVAFHPGSLALASGGLDASLRIWAIGQ